MLEAGDIESVPETREPVQKGRGGVLTEAQVREACDLYAAGAVTRAELAARYGVSRHAIDRVVARLGLAAGACPKRQVEVRRAERIAAGRARMRRRKQEQQAALRLERAQAPKETREEVLSRLAAERARRQRQLVVMLQWLGSLVHYAPDWELAAGNVCGVSRAVMARLLGHGVVERISAHHTSVLRALGLLEWSGLRPLHQVVDADVREALRVRMVAIVEGGGTCSPRSMVERVPLWVDERGGFGDVYASWCAEHHGPMTLEEVGVRMGGICRERIRQIEESALAKIRRKAERGDAGARQLLTTAAELHESTRALRMWKREVLS